MRIKDWTWAYWTLFGLALSTVAVLGTLVFLRLRNAYYMDALTRETLLDALVLSCAILVCLLLSGWAYSHRPPRHRHEETDPIWT